MCLIKGLDIAVEISYFGEIIYCYSCTLALLLMSLDNNIVIHVSYVRSAEACLLHISVICVRIPLKFTNLIVSKLLEKNEKETGSCLSFSKKVCDFHKKHSSIE